MIHDQIVDDIVGVVTFAVGCIGAMCVAFALVFVFALVLAGIGFVCHLCYECFMVGWRLL